MKFNFNPYLLKQWRAFIVGPDMPRYDRYDSPSRTDGVYFLFEGEDLLYVGQSTFVMKRIEQHRNSWRPFSHWGCLHVPGNLLKIVETAYIRVLRTPQNRYVPPQCEPPSDLLEEAILDAWRVSAKTEPPATETTQTEDSMRNAAEASR